MSNQSLKTSPDSNFDEILYNCWFMREYQNKNKSRSSIIDDRSLNFDPNRILTTTLMPVTLLLIKLEKQSIYHWKANKHASTLLCMPQIT